MVRKHDEQAVGLADIACQFGREFVAGTHRGDNRVSTLMWSLILLALSSAGPNNPQQFCTSRKAFSKLSGSTSSVDEKEMFRTWRATWAC